MLELKVLVLELGAICRLPRSNEAKMFVELGERNCIKQRKIYAYIIFLRYETTILTNTLAASAVVVGKVSALAHEIYEIVQRRKVEHFNELRGTVF